MRSTYEIPKLSLAERDRRWANVRARMAQKKLDCLVLTGWPVMYDFNVANARYLCPVGGNSTHNILVFPIDLDPTCFVFSAVGLDYWFAVQDWVKDVRPRRGPWGDTVVERLKELGLARGTIGLDGLAGPLDPDGWLPASMYERMKAGLPDARFVAIDDLMEMARAIKSAEEIGVLKQAAGLGDAMLARCNEAARPGVKECSVYAEMRAVMLAGGGEEPTLFLWASDPQPLAHPFFYPSQRPLAKGDLILTEIHPKYGGYCTHVERTFSLGEPHLKYRTIYDGCIEAYRTGLSLFGPGQKMSEAMEAVKDAILTRGLGMCETGIHGHGLGSLEYPRYRHHAIRADQNAIEAIGDELKPGMVFAFNIDLFDPKWKNGETGCVFAETVLITETGAERMHTYSLDLQTLPT